MTRAPALAFLAALLVIHLPLRSAPPFQPGQVWLDTANQPIQAHSAGFLTHGQTTYWYGEDRTLRTKTTVSCYSSTDLYHWKREATVFSPDDLPQPLRDARTFIERPKVLFNPRTKKYILWCHLEQRGYHYSHAGIATADSPTGPFTFLHAIRPIQFDPGYPPNDPDNQKSLGGTFRDMNLFLDDDGQAYVFYASEGNWTLYVVRLNPDFTAPQLPAVQNQTWARILPRKMREAPAPFKFKNTYFLITSGCTGWTPNPADYATAPHPLGPWTSHGNPAAGPGADKTFNAQSTFVLPVPNRPGSFIFMADQWNPRNLPDSRYLWLPFTLSPQNTFTLTPHPSWDLSIFSN